MLLHNQKRLRQQNIHRKYTNKEKNAPIAVPKLSKTQLDTLAKSMAVPLKGMKDPAIKQMNLVNYKTNRRFL